MLKKNIRLHLLWIPLILVLLYFYYQLYGHTMFLDDHLIKHKLYGKDKFLISIPVYMSMTFKLKHTSQLNHENVYLKLENIDSNKVYTVKPTVESPYELFFYCRSSFNSGAFQDFPYIPPGKYIIQLVFPPDINGNSIGSFMLTGRSQGKYRKDKDKYQNIITEVAKECGCPRKLDNLIWCKMPNSEGKN